MPIHEYREIGNHRGYSITATLTERPSEWYVDVRVGTYEGTKFVQKYGALNRAFEKPAGALNCLLTMGAEAQKFINRHIDGRSWLPRAGDN